MNEKIEWEDSDTRVYRCWLRVVRIWEAPSGRIGGQTEGAATVDDLRRACEAAGLTLATAQHAEDLAKLGREMNAVVAQRNAAREEAERGRSESIARIDEARLELRSFAGESLLQAAKRMVRAYEAENANFKGACAAVEECRRFMNEASAVLGVGPTYDPNSALVAAARRVVAERDAAIARAEIAEAKVAELADAALDTTERDAMAAELAAIRAATGEEPTDAGLLTAYQDTWSRTAGDVEGRTAARRALYNLGRAAALGEVARMREEVVTLRARVAELEAAPQGQPVATDDEVWKVFASAEREATVNGAWWLAADRAGALAVAARVRAERPACLVARAVALGCDVSVVTHDVGRRWNICGWDNKRSASFDRYSLPAADVPATLSRLLDEVEAARNGGA